MLVRRRLIESSREIFDRPYRARLVVSVLLTEHLRNVVMRKFKVGDRVRLKELLPKAFGGFGYVPGTVFEVAELTLADTGEPAVKGFISGNPVLCPVSQIENEEAEMIRRKNLGTDRPFWEVGYR